MPYNSIICSLFSEFLLNKLIFQVVGRLKNGYGGYIKSSVK